MSSDNIVNDRHLSDEELEKFKGLQPDAMIGYAEYDAVLQGLYRHAHIAARAKDSYKLQLVDAHGDIACLRKQNQELIEEKDSIESRRIHWKDRAMAAESKLATLEAAADIVKSMCEALEYAVNKHGANKKLLLSRVKGIIRDYKRA